MKRIETVIRPEKVADVCEALDLAGHYGVTISEVEGRSGGHGWIHLVRGSSFTDTARHRSRLEIVVRDEDAGRAVKMIRDAVVAGGVDEADIFVHDLADVIRIRTGQNGAAAV